jgi:hypothetical protein
LNKWFFLKIVITFNEHEVSHSPFLINVDLEESTPEIIIHDAVDSPGNEITRMLIIKTERM